MFLRNTWYVAAWSSEIGRELTSLKLLGEDVVFYRTEDGKPVALEDACPHRKLPLSMGNLRGDTVECGYHGLTFDCSGSCVLAPTQGQIPGSARVRSYPVADKWDLLWIWMGDPALANEDEIFEVPNFDDPTWGKTGGDAITIDCNYLWVTDNLLDPSHVAWVHVSSFGGAGTEDVPLETDVLEDGIIVWRWMLDRPPPPYYAKLVKFDGNADRKQHYEVRFPSIAVNKSIYTPTGKGGPDVDLPDDTYIMISYNFMTPIDEDRTRYHWFQHRNTDPDDADISKMVADGARMAFEEDRQILTAVHEGMANKVTPNLNLGLDAGAMRFRRMLDRRIEEEQTSAAAE